MRKIMMVGTVLAVLAAGMPAAVSAQEGETPDYAVARLNYVRGEVAVERASDLGTEKGEVNLPLVEGDKLKTKDGQAEVGLGRRNFLRLDALTVVEFAGLPSDSDSRIRIHVLEGRAYFRAGSLQGEKTIEIHTPDASFYVLEEGLYRFDVRTGRETEAFVRDGSLEAAGEQGSVAVEAGQKIVAADGEVASGPETAYASTDAFDRWNRTRDDLLARRSGTSRLPVELSDYEEELEDNGRWVYEEPYGYVWSPTIYDVDWRPYYHGRWSWYPLFGWTWIPYESWGWCTFHYGRWSWRSGLGWYWIPRHAWGRHWGPAWVHWYWDNDYVGWCPLGYHNRPVALVGNRFYDRYSDPYYPRNSRAATFIRRDQLQSRDISRRSLTGRDLDSLNRVNLRAKQPDIRPLSGRTGLGSVAPLRSGAGIVSKGSLKASSPRGIPRTYAPSGSASRGFSGSAGGTISSRGIRRYDGSSGNPSSARGSEIRTYAPSRFGAVRGGTQSSRTIRKDSLGSAVSGGSGRIREYSSRIVSEPRSTGFQARSGSISGARTGGFDSSRIRSYSPSRSTPVSPSRPYSGSSARSLNGFSPHSSSPRSYAPPSRSFGSSSRSLSPYSSRSYSGSSSGRSSGRSYSAPTRSSGPSSRSLSSSSSGRSPSSGPSRSSGASRSSSSPRSGGVRKK